MDREVCFEEVVLTEKEEEKEREQREQREQRDGERAPDLRQWIPAPTDPAMRAIYHKNADLYIRAWTHRQRLPPALLLVAPIYPRDVLATLDMPRFYTEFPYDKLWFRMAFGATRSVLLSAFGMGRVRLGSAPASPKK